MRQPVQLYIRVRLDDGSYPYLKAVILKNGHVRHGYAVNAGREIKVPGGTYNLRYQRDGRRVWEPVGSEPDVALLALRRKVRELEDETMGLACSRSGHQYQSDTGSRLRRSCARLLRL
jgi:integrase/recombinase XerD